MHEAMKYLVILLIHSYDIVIVFFATNDLSQKKITHNYLANFACMAG